MIRTRGRGRADDRGSAAAELALALPAVVLVLALGVGAMGAAVRQVALQDATADAARLLGRGEPPSAAGAALARAVPDSSWSSTPSGEVVCVRARSDFAVGGLRVPLTASSCALAGGL